MCPILINECMSHCVLQKYINVDYELLKSKIIIYYRVIIIINDIIQGYSMVTNLEWYVVDIGHITSNYV